MTLTTPQEELISPLISDDQNCHDTPVILTRPSNCSTILLRISVCLDNGETAHLSLVDYGMANIIDKKESTRLHSRPLLAETNSHTGVIGRLS